MKWLISLIFISTLSLFLFTDLFNPSTQKKDNYGQVLSLTGILMGKASEEESFQHLQINSPIGSSYKIITPFNSSGRIQYGDKFQILEDSAIELRKFGNKFQVHLIKGELKRQGPSHFTEFLVNNQITEDLHIKTTNSKTTPVAEAHLNTESKKENSQKNEIQKQLHKTFKLHKRFIEKCFIKHYERQKGKTQSGTILLTFEINKKGRLQAIAIKKSLYQDQKFHQCIKEVSSRVRLKKKPQDLIKVEFPLQINLPE